MKTWQGAERVEIKARVRNDLPLRKPWPFMEMSEASPSEGPGLGRELLIQLLSLVEVGVGSDPRGVPV